MKKDRATRRDILKTAMAASAAIFPLPAVAQQSGGRVVVVGGGFGGAACARALKRSNVRLDVSLIEANRIYTACPMSNAAIAGLRDLKLQNFGYDRVAAARRHDGICRGHRDRSGRAQRQPRRRTKAFL